MGYSKQHEYKQSKNLGIKNENSEEYLTASTEEITDATREAKTAKYKAQNQIQTRLAICYLTKPFEIPAELS